MLWAGSYTEDFTRVTAGDAHFSLKTCVAISFNSTSILATGLSAGAEVRHTDTWLRAEPTCGYWAGSSTPDLTRVTAGDAHFSPKTCVATRFNSNRILDTGLIAGAEVRHTDTWLRAGPTCGGGAHTIHALPARALFVAFAPSATGLKLGPSGARDGGQRATYEGCSHQLERLTSRDAAASQPASQLVEVAVGGLFAHLGPLSPKGGTRGLGPPHCTTKLSMRRYKPWRNF